jgi:rod shape-determining protein MreD
MNKKRDLYFKIILLAAAVALLGAVQLSIIKALPYPFNAVNLVIISLVFVLLFADWRSALWWSFGLGLMLDLYSFAPFGINLLGLAGTLLIVNFLLTNFLTNRSLYSVLILNTVAYLVYEIIIYALYFGLVFLTGGQLPLVFDLNFLSGQLYGWLLNLIVAFLLFYFLNFASRRYLPFFLIRKKSN